MTGSSLDLTSSESRPVTMAAGSLPSGLGGLGSAHLDPGDSSPPWNEDPADWSMGSEHLPKDFDLLLQFADQLDQPQGWSVLWHLEDWLGQETYQAMH